MRVYVLLCISPTWSKQGLALLSWKTPNADFRITPIRTLRRMRAGWPTECGKVIGLYVVCRCDIGLCFLIWMLYTNRSICTQSKSAMFDKQHFKFDFFFFRFALARWAVELNSRLCINIEYDRSINVWNTVYSSCTFGSGFYFSKMQRPLHIPTNIISLCNASFHIIYLFCPLPPPPLPPINCYAFYLSPS